MGKGVMVQHDSGPFIIVFFFLWLLLFGGVVIGVYFASRSLLTRAVAMNFQQKITWSVMCVALPIVLFLLRTELWDPTGTDRSGELTWRAAWVVVVAIILGALSSIFVWRARSSS